MISPTLSGSAGGVCAAFSGAGASCLFCGTDGFTVAFWGVSLLADSYGLAAREIRNNTVAKHRVKAYIVKRQIHYLLMSLRNDKAGIYSVAG